MTTARKIANARMNVPHDDGHAPRQCNLPECPDVEKTPTIETGDLWSMSIDRHRLQTQWDAACAAIEQAKGHMRAGFDCDPVAAAGARDMHFAKAWHAIAHLGRA